MPSTPRLLTALLSLAACSSIACVVTTEDDGTTNANDTGTDTNSENQPETGTETDTTGDDDLCTQSCTVAAECSEEVTLEDCVTECQDLFEALEEVPACIPPNEDLVMCIAGLDCEGFTAYLEGGPGAPCASEEEALGECGDPGCILDIEGDADGCLANYTCSGSAEVREVECSFADGCVCRIDGEQVGACEQADLVCTPDPIEPLGGVNDCCGWELG